MLLNIVWIVLGFALLIKGGDFLVDGAVAIAKRAKLSPMVIGLTIVGFGTSAPELLVSVQAALAGSSGIAIGNVVGSNIANIALILGAAALIKECAASKQTLKIDMSFMFFAAAMFVCVAMSGTISRIAGIIGFLLLVIFIYWQIRHSREEAQQESDEDKKEPMALWKALIMVAVSFAALVFGADKLIEGATFFAKEFGVSERIIGLTIIAVGTSLPELFASIAAARKGETDMAIGNVVGSVTFNILSVVGLSAAICPIENSNVGFLTDYVWMVGLAGLLWFFLFTNRKLERWEGGILVLLYAVYVTLTVVMAK